MLPSFFTRGFVLAAATSWLQKDCSDLLLQLVSDTSRGGDEACVDIMHSCGEVSEIAWRVVGRGADFFMTIPDDAAVEAMRLLADKTRAGLRIAAGESAGAGLAGLMVVCTDPRTKAELHLDRRSRVLLFGTEGATDPALYEALVGSTAS